VPELVTRINPFVVLAKSFSLHHVRMFPESDPSTVYNALAFNDRIFSVIFKKDFFFVT